MSIDKNKLIRDLTIDHRATNIK